MQNMQNMQKYAKYAKYEKYAKFAQKNAKHAKYAKYAKCTKIFKIRQKAPNMSFTQNMLTRSKQPKMCKIDKKKACIAKNATHKKILPEMHKISKNVSIAKIAKKKNIKNCQNPYIAKNAQNWQNHPKF